jgi:2-methylaconitate cis-trans-isomerase PrpF
MTWTTCSARSQSTSPSWTGPATAATLSAAVGPFAITHGLLDPARVPQDGICTVCVWQANIGRTIVAHVPVSGGEVQETGDFELDGVTFPAGEGEQGGTMFPTGQLVDDLEVPGVGTFKATLINAGIPIIFLNAADTGYTGTELQDAINGDKAALERFGPKAKEVNEGRTER